MTDSGRRRGAYNRSRDSDQIPSEALRSEAVGKLRGLLAEAKAGLPGSAAALSLIDARDGVLARYQPIFAPDRLPALSEEEFRQFLHFKNNRHWAALQRMGPAICADMKKLRSALGILLDESIPIRDRLSTLIPTRGPAFVPRLGRAVLTPILLINHPGKYGVWNQVSEGAMKTLAVWPEFDKGLGFGDQYVLVNKVLLETAASLGTDLWTLDALWWRITDGQQEDAASELAEEAESLIPASATEVRFGLERHLHEFLRDNWDRTSLGREWKLYEEPGDSEAGYEYPCPVGRIDLLARHRKNHRWLVVELKRGQTGDQTVAQVLRYMGWVKEHLAEDGESVEGLVIGHEADPTIGYALSVVPNVGLQLYEVEFRLKEGTLTAQGREAPRI